MASVCGRSSTKISAKDVLLGELLGRQRLAPQAVNSLIARVLAHDALVACGIRSCIRCGEVLGKNLETTGCCEVCARSRGTPEYLIALGGYNTGLGVLLSAAKYGRWPEVLGALGARLGDATLARLGARGVAPIIVPMPAPMLRRWHRGINHSGELATAVARVTGWESASLLQRRWEATQVGASASQRDRGARRLAPAWRAAKRLIGRSVVLVDDVRTSGTSLARASRCCRRLGATHVVAAVVAVRREDVAKSP